MDGRNHLRKKQPGGKLKLEDNKKIWYTKGDSWLRQCWTCEIRREIVEEYQTSTEWQKTGRTTQEADCLLHMGAKMPGIFTEGSLKANKLLDMFNLYMSGHLPEDFYNGGTE